ncbi:LacI family DNA-binding transcriptional regulator [Neobacillus thermocopriae]|uniref:LacI family DNA-binding transcriptional regulator n=1 Tax=Neobacillus thermocopriae TaxID=1215031 RepID=UPI003770457F
MSLINKRVTLEDIAKIAGVSKMAVSLALRGDSSISASTSKKIKQIAAELGYIPNRMAQGLNTGRSHTIGLLIGGKLHDDYQNQFIKGAIPYAIKRGYTVSIGPSECDPQVEKYFIEKYNHMMVDGYLAFHCNEIETYKDLQNSNKPFVFYTKYFENLEADYVVCHDFHGGYTMTKHLIELGHRKIAFVYDTELESSSEVVARIKGYRKALTDYGLPFSRELMIPFNLSNYNHINPNKIYDENAQFIDSLKQVERPTALFVCNDITASFVYIILKKLKLSIPEDISIGGYEGIYLGSIIDPPLTTIATPIVEMGRKACEILIDKIEGRIPLSEKVQIQLEPKLLIRNSTRSVSPRVI